MGGMKTIDMNRNEIGGLVSLDPSFVRQIAVVSRTGSLLSLSSSHSSLIRAEAVNNVFNDFKKEKNHFQTSSEYSSNQIKNKRDLKPRSSPVISKHNQFVSNIQFGSWSLERKGEEQQSSQLDSLVSNSLLDFTKPNLALRNEGLIGTAPNLSATVLDTSEDLNNLYRTISRKRILNKVQCSNFHLHDDDEECSHHHSQQFHDAVLDPRVHGLGGMGPAGLARPLARLIAKMHSTSSYENTYASLNSETLYTSLTRNDDENNNMASDKNNMAASREHVNDISTAKEQKHEKQNGGKNGAGCCPVLLSSLAASQAETKCHAMAGCPDCLEYSTALHHSLPRLLGPAEQDAQCKLHGYSDPELGLYPPGVYGWPRGGQVVIKAPLTRRKEGRIVCYLAGVILAILALVAVIVVLTLMVANKEMEKVASF